MCVIKNVFGICCVLLDVVCSCRNVGSERGCTVIGNPDNLNQSVSGNLFAVFSFKCFISVESETYLAEFIVITDTIFLICFESFGKTYFSLLSGILNSDILVCYFDLLTAVFDCYFVLLSIRNLSIRWLCFLYDICAEIEFL